MVSQRRYFDWCLVSRIALLTVPSLALSVALSVAAQAAPQVYHSPADNGVPAAVPDSLPLGGIQSVFLYIDGGATASAPGTACDTGAGDEVCAYELNFVALSGLTVAGFSPDAGADVVVNQSAGSLTINGLDTEAPTSGPQRIGAVQVNTVAGGLFALWTSETVAADLSQDATGIALIAAVPEPATSALLASGIAGLAMLARCFRGRSPR